MTQLSQYPIFHLITPEFSGSLNRYLISLEKNLKQGIKIIQFRSKELSLVKYTKIATEMCTMLQAYQATLLLNHADSKLLLDIIPAHGIHLPSEMALRELKRPIATDYLLSVACHNKTEIEQAEKIKADFIVISPIFYTPTSPDKIPLGWEKFNALVKTTSIPAYALGGLNKTDAPVAFQSGACGVAGIRNFWDATT